MHPNDFAFQKEACRCYEDVKNGLSSLKHKCNKQNIEMKVKICQDLGEKKRNWPTDRCITLWLMVQGDVLIASWGFILMTNSHVLSAFFPRSMLTLSPKDLPCLQESMARRRIYSLRGGNKFCAFFSPFHERLFQDDTNIWEFPKFIILSGPCDNSSNFHK